MLAADHRLRRSADFTAVLRRGRRAGGGLVVVQALVVDGPSAEAVPVRCGLVVSKAVGNSVVRHRVSRRLRAVLAARLDRFAATGSGVDIVVRALPAAADATSAQLGASIDAAWRKVRPTSSGSGQRSDHRSAVQPAAR